MNFKSKTLLENIKDQIISEVFHNEEISLEEKINFCQQLESFGESWRNLIFTQELKEKERKEKGELNEIARSELIAKLKSMVAESRGEIK